MEVFFSIIFGVGFTAAPIMLVHMLYALLVARGVRTVTQLDFINSREREGRSPEATEEENQRAADIMTDMFASWVVMKVVDGEEFRAPLTNSQMKSAKRMLKVVLKIKPTDEKQVERYNKFAEVVNNLNKREFNGSWYFAGGISIVILLLSFLTGFDSGFFQILMPGVGLYVLASYTPLFVLERREWKDKNRNNHYSALMLGGIFAGIANVPTIKWVARRVSDNKPVAEGEDDSHFLAALVLGVILIILLSVVVIIIAIFCYIRNYIFPVIAFSAISQKELLKESDGSGYVFVSNGSALRVGRLEVTSRQLLGCLAIVGSVALFVRMVFIV